VGKDCSFSTPDRQPAESRQSIPRQQWSARKARSLPAGIKTRSRPSGTYSLRRRSPDEIVTLTLLSVAYGGRLNVQICYVVLPTPPTSCLACCVFSRLESVEIPMIPDVNMVRYSSTGGIRIDAETWPRNSGIPVVKSLRWARTNRGSSGSNRTPWASSSAPPRHASSWSERTALKSAKPII